MKYRATRLLMLLTLLRTRILRWVSLGSILLGSSVTASATIDPVNLLGTYGFEGQIGKLSAHPTNPAWVLWTKDSIQSEMIPDLDAGVLRSVAPGDDLPLEFVATIGASAVRGITVGGKTFSRQFTTKSVYTSPKFKIQGPFKVWWDATQDFSAHATDLLKHLEDVRDQSWAFGMRDTPSIRAGFYQNIYFHSPGDNPKPPGSGGNGVGTDSNKHPFFGTGGSYNVIDNHYHEGFHLFQYSANSPGFAYSGDSAWYIEASANWMASINLPLLEGVFPTASAIYSNPQLPLWRTFNSSYPSSFDEPKNWNRETHQYGLNTFLAYLTEVAKVPRSIIVQGFYAKTSLKPQAYLSSQIGAEAFREHFADWAAHNAASFDYLTRAQWIHSLGHLKSYGDPADIHPYVRTFYDEGTDGQWIAPQATLMTQGWSYHLYQIINSSAATYNFSVRGGLVGTAGSPSRFAGRVVVINNGGNRFLPIPMTTQQDGTLSIEASSSDSEVFLVVASVPDSFTGTQTYPYQVKIERVDPKNPGVSIVDPSFEASTPNGWIASDASRVGRISDGAPFADNGAIPDGTGLAHIRSDAGSGAMSLTSANGIRNLLRGQSYNLRFRVNAKAGLADAKGRVTVDGVSTSFVVAPVASQGDRSTPYHFISINFTASRTTVPLAFSNDSSEESVLLLDDVTVSRVSSAAWAVTPWTDDPSTGITSGAIMVYDLGGKANSSINGYTVIGVAGGNPSVSGKFHTKGLAVVGSRTNDLTSGTGGSATMAADWVEGGTPGTLTLTNLTPGVAYALSVFSVGSGSSAQTSTFDASGSRFTVDAGALGPGRGLRLDHFFRAASRSQTITFTPTSPAYPFPVHGFALQKLLVVSDASDSAPFSLRKILGDAASSPGSKTITFSPGLDGATLRLDSQLSIGSDVVIDASQLSHGITLTGAGADRIFEIKSGGTVTLRGLTLTGGHANATAYPLNSGGAIFNAGNLTLERCTLAENSAGSGGAIRSETQLTVDSCTLSNNSSTIDGGAIFSGGTLTIRNSTIAGNSTGGPGGGVDKLAGTLTLINSIIAKNTSAFGGKDLAGAVNTREGVNFIGNPTGASGLGILKPHYLTGDPLLTSLADHGGPTWTMALMPGSPAINAAGATQAAPAIDQRGVSRPVDSKADIGAFEYVGAENVAPLLVSISNRTNDWSETLSITLKATDPDGPADKLRFALVDAPVGAELDPVTGRLTWTPTPAEPPSVYRFTAEVTDDGFPKLSTVQKFSVVVLKANQRITFDVLAPKTYGDRSLLLDANASSGLPPSYSILSGPATVDGNLLKITGTGTITVQASQPGDAFFGPAAPVDRSFEVTKASQTIDFPSLGEKQAGDPAFPLEATATSGLPVTFTVVSGPATLQGTQLSVTDAGSIIIRASQAGDSNFNAADDVMRSFSAMVRLAPALAITLSGGKAIFTWPSSASGFLLESTGDPFFQNWSIATPSPVLLEGQNVVTIESTGVARFYRLRRP